MTVEEAKQLKQEDLDPDVRASIMAEVEGKKKAYLEK